jgi:hypothetical protein
MENARIALQRLIEERGEDYSGLSRLLGRNAAYVQQYIKRGSPKRLAEQDRKRLARYFGVEEALLGGDGAAAAAEGDALRPVSVPLLDVGASAGAGAAVDGERTRAHVAFDPAWLRKVASGGPDGLSIIRVDGDSMLPTLAHGDEILVDRCDGRQRLRDGIYVLRPRRRADGEAARVQPGEQKCHDQQRQWGLPVLAGLRPGQGRAGRAGGVGWKAIDLTPAPAILAGRRTRAGVRGVEVDQGDSQISAARRLAGRLNLLPIFFFGFWSVPAKAFWLIVLGVLPWVGPVPGFELALPWFLCSFLAGPGCCCCRAPSTSRASGNPRGNSTGAWASSASARSWPMAIW